MSTGELIFSPNRKTWRSRWVSRVRRAAAGFLDLAFPRTCLACGLSLYDNGEADLCSACSAAVRWITRERCPACGDQIGPHVPTDRRCWGCRGMALVFKKATAPCKYDGTARQLVINLKYRKQMPALRALSRFTIEDLTQADFLDKIEVVVPVPLYWRRRFLRGFNQSELLARRIGRHFSIPVCANRLCRVRDTISQAALTRAERLENLKDAFSVRGRNTLEGKTVLLCDDVMTTGATAIECSRALRDAGVKQVYVSVAAR